MANMEHRQPRWSSSDAGGGGIPSWPQIVGLITVIGGLFWGSRVLVTQDQLEAVESRVSTAATLVLSQSKEDHAELWRELEKRERNAFRQKNWSDAKKWIEAEIKRLDQRIDTK